MVMKQGIVVVTWSGGREQLKTLLASLNPPSKYEVIVVVNDSSNAEWINEEFSGKIIKLLYDGFELGAIKAVLEQTDLDEFILLQDTFEVLDNSLFEILFDNYPNQSVAYNDRFQMYLGKFRREILERMDIPDARTKIDSVMYESIFTNMYRAIDPVVVFNGRFDDCFFPNNWEDRWGRKNKVLSDQYLIKRKGLWNASMLYE